MPTPPSATTFFTPASEKTQKTCSEASPRFTPRRHPCILTASASRGPCGPVTRKWVNSGERPNGVSKTSPSPSTSARSSFSAAGKSNDSDPLPPQIPKCAVGTTCSGMEDLLVVSVPQARWGRLTGRRDAGRPVAATARAKPAAGASRHSPPRRLRAPTHRACRGVGRGIHVVAHLEAESQWQRPKHVARDRTVGR